MTTDNDIDNETEKPAGKLHQNFISWWQSGARITKDHSYYRAIRTNALAAWTHQAQRIYALEHRLSVERKRFNRERMNREEFSDLRELDRIAALFRRAALSAYDRTSYLDDTNYSVTTFKFESGQELAIFNKLLDELIDTASKETTKADYDPI
jgi:hypothetical protein